MHTKTKQNTLPNNQNKYIKTQNHTTTQIKHKNNNKNKHQIQQHNHQTPKPQLYLLQSTTLKKQNLLNHKTLHLTKFQLMTLPQTAPSNNSTPTPIIQIY